MSFSFSSLVRLIVLTALGLTLAAVGLSKLDPPEPARRVARPARFFNINEYYLNVADRAPRWLDSETGRLEAHPLGDGDVLEAASSSPWVDEKGRHQVVGRWSTRTQSGPQAVSVDFGLARYTFPDGQMLDQVSAEEVPVGPPCWYPGTRARVLFAAGDGQLYHFAFEPEALAKKSDPAAPGDARPMPLGWRCRRPGDGGVFLGDLSWPSDPRMGGCVLVSLREQDSSADGPRAFSRSRIWWLKLNYAGTEVVEAGPLLDDRDPSHLDPDERCPVAGALPGGRLAVFYLKQCKDSGWELRAAAIEPGPDRHSPRAAGPEVVIASGCQPAQPALSADGKWLDAIVGTYGTGCRIARFSTAGLSRSGRAK